MILPAVRDPRLVTVRRGGTLTDEDHHRLALWAAACAEHVLPLFEASEHDLGAAAYAIKAAVAAAPAGQADGVRRAECRWQRDRLPVEVRDLVLEDQGRRNAICWNVFDV